MNRYTCLHHDGMAESAEGDYVRHADAQAAIAAAVAAEREACAKVADACVRQSPVAKAREYAARIAMTIRARGAA